LKDKLEIACSANAIRYRRRPLIDGSAAPDGENADCRLRAHPEMDTIAARPDQQYPDSNRRIRLHIDPLIETFRVSCAFYRCPFRSVREYLRQNDLKYCSI